MLEVEPCLPRLEFSLLSLPGLEASMRPSLTTERSDLLLVLPSPAPPSSPPGVVALLLGCVKLVC